MKKIPLVIKTWAGDAAHDMDYIQRSIPSLLASHLPDNLDILIYDDCSPNPQIQTYLSTLAKQDRRVRIFFGNENKGPNRGQQDIYDLITAEYPHTPYFLNADDDVIYHRDWLTKLDQAYHHCRDIGLNGVFSAIHMPFRRAHSEIKMQGGHFLLKWSQPALNWLIPADLYEEIGPFVDEGIAYDTVYCHWMRLKQRCVICMTPSYVQNVGLLGAYAFDDTTTSTDFVGEGGGHSKLSQLLQSLRYHGRRLPYTLRRQFDDSAELLGPVRWGSEFVHEGRYRGRCVALYSFLDARRLGWSDAEAAERADRILLSKDPSARIVAVRKNRRGEPIWVESEWEFNPNLRELRTLAPDRIPTIESIFLSLIAQLCNLHSQGIVHNKIRQDNVFLENKPAHSFRLTWLGTEPHPGTPLDMDNAQSVIPLLSGALNRWAQPETEEMFATRYLESLAPEVTQGLPATMASDVYSAAAVSLLTHHPQLSTLNELRELRQQWAHGVIPSLDNISNTALRDCLRQALQMDSQQRPVSAQAIAQQFKR